MASATPGKQGAGFLPLMGIFCNYLLLFIFVAKGRTSEFLVDFNLGFCDILEKSIFCWTHIMHFIVVRVEKNPRLHGCEPEEGFLNLCQF